MHCARCQSHDLFDMDLTVGGEPAHFFHCRSCEHRWWLQTSGGDTLELRDVLSS
ncbi:MAG: hypothetical protein ACR2KP_08980 [Egibacteraceae bacterium]